MFNIQSLIQRIRKKIVFLLAIPILLGLTGWFLPVGKMPAKYTATATLTLGNYDDVDLNDQDHVVLLLTHEMFYQKQLPNVWRKYQQNLLSNLQVTPLKDQLLQLSVTGSSKKDAIQLANTISNAFLSLDQQHFRGKKAIIQETMDHLKNSSVSSDTKVEELTFLYKLETDILKTKPAMLLDSADQHTEAAARRFSAKDRAILGFILGLAFAFFWLVIPELFQDKSK